MNHKTFKICYKLIFGINGICILLWGYISGMLNTEMIQNSYRGDYQYFTEEFITTYTFLSNILVLTWLIYSGIFHSRENKNKYQSQGFATAISCYISVTFIVYNFVLIPVEGWPSSAADQAITIIDHMVNPIVMVVYLVFLMENKTKINLKEFFIKKFIWVWAGTLAYCVFAMLRGELRVNSDPNFEGRYYPYFFLDVHSGLGVLWFLMAFVSITGMLIGFSFLYNYASNQMIEKDYYKAWSGLEVEKTNKADKVEKVAAKKTPKKTAVKE
ncbi:Pr6Pr family membrane protein [Spiroplasma endosymbiont of Panorpa germanica]|uniref:Pr6Pr family membrane protein n=1 Tax=Spiroplasma endosymbiont of Panorpa germanica TaxID=3066314 RepID=UPI0030D4FDBB